MLRHTLARTALRSSRTATKASRVFSTTPQRRAEVELTIGTQCIAKRTLREYKNKLTMAFRWQEGLN